MRVDSHVAKLRKKSRKFIFTDILAIFVSSGGFRFRAMISLTVPIYNEEGSIEELFERVRTVMNRHGEPWEVIFINDGSLDRSEEILNKLATAHREVKVIHFRRNFGQTAAMMAGFDFATGDIIVPMDGDGQNDPEDIPRMLAKLHEGFDVCSGWRGIGGTTPFSGIFPASWPTS